jgi:O-antigen/teichoic acid export membrane protein
MSLQRNFIWMLCSRGTIILSSLIIASLTTRALGPKEMGVFAEMQTWIALFFTLFCISMDSAIYHFANEARYSISKHNQCVTIVFMTIAYGLTAVIFLIIYSTLWPSQFSTQAKALIALMSAIIFLTMITGNLIIFIQAIGDIKFPAILSAVQMLVNCILIAIAYRCRFLNITYIFSVLFFLQCTNLLFLLLYFKRKKYLQGTFLYSLAIAILKAGLKQHAATISTFLYVKLNQLIVFQYCGEKQAGFFAVALNLAIAITVIPMTLQSVLYPRVIHSHDEYEITMKLVKYGLLLWGAFVCICFLFSENLITLYAGDKFTVSAIPFKILLITTWLLPLSSFASPYLIKKGAFVFCSISAVSLGVLSILLNFYLVPQYLSTGAAIATAITSFTGFIVICCYLYLENNKPTLKVSMLLL